LLASTVSEICDWSNENKPLATLEDEKWSVYLLQFMYIITVWNFLGHQIWTEDRNSQQEFVLFCRAVYALLWVRNVPFVLRFWFISYPIKSQSEFWKIFRKCIYSSLKWISSYGLLTTYNLLLPLLSTIS
jgi:hypothetical protein